MRIPLALVLFFFAAVQVTANNAKPPHDLATTRITLTRGDYAARFYDIALGTHPRGLVVFGSGDGGWSYWEERVSRHLAARGFAVAGVDFRLYAEAPFSTAIIRKDYQQLVAALRGRRPEGETLPLLYGGWSMGAEQSLPAAADPAQRPAGLRGFILVAPGARGRYGMKLSDRMGITPTGPDTFALREIAPACADLRFAVFHAGLDIVDDLKWSQGLVLDYRRWLVPRTMHDFSNAGPPFLSALDEAMIWLLEPPAAPSLQ